jgi:hypothetical protein
MGIFGYLSKAHLDQAVPTGDVASKVAIIDEKIKTEKENVDAARGQLKQMDAQVDQTMSRSDDSKGAERSLQIRRGQQKERSALLAEIGSAQTRIARLNEERAPIAAELRKVEAEVGPIKYIAALLYGDNPDQTILEKAVRIVIIMIVIVFDPLAVLLLMAANIPTVRRNENGNYTEETTSSEENTSDEESTIQTSLNQIKESSNIIKERFFRRFKPTEKPVVVERTSESSSSGAGPETSTRIEPTISGDTSGEDRSAGVTSTTEDQSTWEIEKLVQVNHEKASDIIEHENIQLDSSARLNQNTPINPELIVDWSNKDQKGSS